MLTPVSLVTLGDYCEFQTAYACAPLTQVTTPKVQGERKALLASAEAIPPLLHAMQEGALAQVCAPKVQGERKALLAPAGATPLAPRGSVKESANNHVRELGCRGTAPAQMYIT